MFSDHYGQQYPYRANTMYRPCSHFYMNYLNITINNIFMMFHFMFVHYTFSSVWVTEWPPIGK